MSKPHTDFVTGKSDLTNIKNVTLNCGESTSTLAINKFDINELCDFPAIVLIGKRQCGKSVFIQNIIQCQLENERIDELLVISPNDKEKNFYNKFVTNVQHQLNYEVLQRILDRQREFIKNDVKNKVMIVLDDCLSRGDWANEQSLREILFNGRHHGISYILSLQFPLGMSPELRSSFDYVCMFHDDIISNLKRIYDHYAGMFPLFSVFKETFTQLTGDYSAMIIVKEGKSIYDKIKWFKASQIDVMDQIKCVNVFDDDDDNNEIQKLNETQISNKNNYDVLFETIKCNQLILNLCNARISAEQLDRIINSNAEIAKLCCENYEDCIN